MNAPAEPVSRAGSSRLLWLTLWASLLALLLTQAVDAWQRAAPPQVWLFWFLPLLVLLPGVLRDKLRSVVWLSFVSLLYFVWAVLRIFAEPESPRAQLELIAVILLFLSTMFYVRARARELRAAQPATDAEEEAA